ncbi:MAG: hypothetical protein HC852_19665 [Acaryochloridaceae cyanobacterium RU_4_10]|nr:hypothetical protein [Acaryochloridaceae cyanobacterium RU_4_10]
MTNPDPSSSDYDIHSIFEEELDRVDRDLIDETDEVDYTTRDEDRLYTDELMRQNEMASRVLLLSVLISGVISVGLGCWYFYAQNRSQPSQNAPLQVPTQPPVSPLPALNPNSNNFSPAPLNPGQTQPPTDSGILPNTLPSANPTLPFQASPNAAGTAVTPPPPPALPSSPQSP